MIESLIYTYFKSSEAYFTRILYYIMSHDIMLVKASDYYITHQTYYDLIDDIKDNICNNDIPKECIIHFLKHKNSLIFFIFLYHYYKDIKCFDKAFNVMIYVKENFDFYNRFKMFIDIFEYRFDNEIYLNYMENAGINEETFKQFYNEFIY